jgi:hypothetical protein
MNRLIGLSSRLEGRRRRRGERLRKEWRSLSIRRRWIDSERGRWSRWKRGRKEL